MKIYDITRFPYMIEVGHDGENNWRPQAFDCSSLLANHQNGVLTLWLLPQGESQAFPVAVERDENVIVWTPLNEEMTAEYGSLQIQCVDGTDVGKSDTAKYHVKGSLVSGAEHPSQTPSWAARVVEATGHYPKIENGTWWVWDVQNGEWSDTGVSAGGDVSPEQLAEAIEEYFDEHPIEAPVQSVNGKTGAVNLSASDVHALPDSYTPPVESVNGKTGAVVLDAEDVGALPDDTVIPVVPQMATDDYIEDEAADWISGRTVDAAVLKTLFRMIAQGISSKQDTISDLASIRSGAAAGSTAVQPSAISDMATQTWVGQQIAAIPDELPDTTSASANDFLCLNAQKQPIWKTVPSAESNSFGGGS